jgi:hypothetical protein
MSGHRTSIGRWAGAWRGTYFPLHTVRIALR